MDEIAGEDGRLSAALDRIEAAIAAVAERPVAAPQDAQAVEPVRDDAAIAALAADLAAAEERAAGAQASATALSTELAEARATIEAERAANAQLVERVRMLKQKQETVIAGLERRVAQLVSDLEGAAGEVARQQRLVAELAEANAALRAAAERNLPDSAGIDRAMAAELTALGALRAAEKAEVDSVLGEIRRLIGEKADA